MGDTSFEKVLEQARTELVERTAMPLLLAGMRRSATITCLSVVAVVAGAGMLAIGMAATLFFLPAVVSSWGRFVGLGVTLVLLVILLVMTVGRARRALLLRSSSRRLRQFNEGQADKARHLAKALADRREPAETTVDAEILFVDGATSLVQLAFVCEPGGALAIATPGGLGEEAPPRRILGLSLWAFDGSRALLLASFLSPLSTSRPITELETRARFAEMPFDELVESARTRTGLDVDELTETFAVGRANPVPR